ncbi:MAG: DUF4392 domain-containing protein [Pirellulales bacterium]
MRAFNVGFALPAVRTPSCGPKKPNFLPQVGKIHTPYIVTFFTILCKLLWILMILSTQLGSGGHCRHCNVSLLQAREGVIIGSFPNSARGFFVPVIDWRLLDALIRHDPGHRGLATARDDQGNLFGDGDLQRAATEIVAAPATRVCIVTGFAVKIGDRVTAETDGPAGAI